MTCATAADGLRARRRLALGEVHRQRRKGENVVGYKIHSRVYFEYHRAAPAFDLWAHPLAVSGESTPQYVMPVAAASHPEQLKVRGQYDRN